MDLTQLTGDERIIAEQAVLAFQAVKQAAAAAPHGQGMAMMEKAVMEQGYETMRRMLELSAAAHPEAQKKGSAASRAPATTPKATAPGCPRR